MDAHWQRMTNRRNVDWEQLRPYFGKYVLWNEDYTAILDSDTDYAKLDARMPPQDPDRFGETIEYLPDPVREPDYWLHRLVAREDGSS